MKDYVEYIDEGEDVTNRELAEYYNQLAEKLNYALNTIYNSPNSADILYWGGEYDD